MLLALGLISSIHILMPIQMHVVKQDDVPALLIDIIVTRGHGKSSSASDCTGLQRKSLSFPCMPSHF